MNESIQTAFQTVVSFKNLETCLGPHLPGAEDSWSALVQRLSPLDLTKGLEFLRDLKRELTAAPAVAKSLLSREVVVVTLRVILELLRYLQTEHTVTTEDLQACAAVLQYCASKSCTQLTAGDLRTALEDLLRSLIDCGNNSLVSSLLPLFYAYSQACERLGSDFSSLAVGLRQLENRADHTPLPGFPAGVTSHLLLLHCLSVGPRHHDFVHQQVTATLQPATEELTQINCLLLMLRLKRTESLVSAAQVCRDFWRFAREVGGDSWPRWVSVSEFQLFWTALRRNNPTDLFFLQPLLDFLEHDVVTPLRSDALQFVLKVALRSAQTRQLAAKVGLVRRKMVGLDLVERLFQEAVYPEELQYVLEHMRHGPALEIASMLVRVAQFSAERKEFECRYSGVPWNLAATVVVPSLRDAVFALGGPEVLLYVLDWVEDQRLRLQLLRLMKMCLSLAPTHFVALLSLKLEENTAYNPLSEEEILELLDLTVHSRSHKKHILLNPRLWRALPHDHYLHYIYPAVINASTNHKELLLELYEELWARRDCPEIWAKATETLDSLQTKAAAEQATDILGLFMARILANKHLEEKVKPLCDTVLSILGRPGLEETILNAAWGLLIGFLQRVATENAPLSVIAWSLRLLELLQRRIPRVATLPRCVDLVKTVVWDLTIELYHTIIRCFACPPEHILPSADVLLRGKPVALSCILELLPRTSHGHEPTIWSDFDGALQRPAIVADIPGFMPAFVEAAVHFLLRDLRTPVYRTVARVLTWRLPSSDNLPALRTFIQTFLSADHRRAWGHFGAIVEQMSLNFQDNATPFLAGLFLFLQEAALTHQNVLEFGFLTIIRSLESYLFTSAFYQLEDSPKRAVLQLLHQAIRDTESDTELQVFLKTLDCVLDVSRNQEDWGDLWSLAELAGAVLDSSPSKQTGICAFLNCTLCGKIVTMQVTFRSLVERLSACELSEVAVLLQQEWAQLQVLISTHRPPSRPRIWTAPDRTAGHSKSIWKGSIPIHILPTRDRGQRLQLMHLRCQWKALKKRMEGLCGVWSVRPRETDWKVANFINAEGLKSRLVQKRGRNAGLRVSRSFVNPPILRLSSHGEEPINAEEPVSAGVVDSPEEWMEQTIPCERIWPRGSVAGQLEVTDNWLGFASRSGPQSLPEGSIAALEHTHVDVHMERAWRWSEILEVWQRRFLHRHTAFELLLHDGRSYFFNCYTEIAQEKFLSAVQKFLPVVRLSSSRTPRGALRKALDEWQQGRMSNLAYLTRINQLAARSYNDLSQYPVFPWVLSEFHSATLNFGSTACLRDLAVPVGAQTEVGRADVRSHYELMRTTSMVPFHFGSHYSTCGLVSYYLVRLQPFTSVAIDLQDGKFDVADRLFNSVATAWHGCLHNAGDFKELIPEFFGLPEMFLNINGCNLGRTQDGVTVNNVDLPPWSRCGENALKSAYHFVSLHRRALESTLVTENLPRWLDLIFGCKQKGVQAIEALNVFFPFTYEDAFNVAFAKANPEDRESMLQQVAYYGQTPVQVLLSAHPKGSHETEAQNWDSESTVFAYNASQPKTVLLVQIRGRIVCVCDNRMLRSAEGNTISLESDPSAVRIPLRGQHFTVNGKVLVSCLYSDCSFKTHSLESGKLLQTMQFHLFPVTCLASEDLWLVAGSEDCTVSVWKFQGEALEQRPEAVLFGHRHPLLRCAVDSVNDVCASVDSAGEILLHALGSQRVLAVMHTQPSAQVVLALSRLRVLAVYNRACEHVDLYTQTGERMDTLVLQSGDLVEVLLFNQAGHLLYTGGSKTVSCFDVFSQRLGGQVLKVVDKTVRALVFTVQETALLVALQSNVVLQFERNQSMRRAIAENLKQAGLW